MFGNFQFGQPYFGQTPKALPAPAIGALDGTLGELLCDSTASTWVGGGIIYRKPRRRKARLHLDGELEPLTCEARATVRWSPEQERDEEELEEVALLLALGVL